MKFLTNFALLLDLSMQITTFNISLVVHGSCAEENELRNVSVSTLRLCSFKREDCIMSCLMKDVLRNLRLLCSV